MSNAFPGPPTYPDGRFPPEEERYRVIGEAAWIDPHDRLRLAVLRDDGRVELTIRQASSAAHAPVELVLSREQVRWLATALEEAMTAYARAAL